MNFSKRIIFFTIIPLFLVSPVLAVNNAYISYIDKYKDWAINQMNRYGVPASITLAQGLLESDAGRSTLAVEGNNHFGIKCHTDWNGRTIYHDDDRRNECFRKYNSAESSFEDHSVFLATHQRYSSLFDLKQTDYKGWAHGLKKAGYATNPQYADKLISIIEMYGLDKYDRKGGRFEKADMIPHQPYLSNGLLYVRLNEGESLKDVAREFETSKMSLRRYNEIDRKFSPESGSVIYLEKKKRKADEMYEIHVVGPDDSLWSISQLYGVKMKSIIRRNNLSSDNPLVVGMQLKIR
jgi:hypothetical protein